MPRWTYQCPECEEARDVIGSLKDFEQDTLVVPSCPVHAVAMERQISATNFVIKGYAASTGYAYKKP